MRYFLSAILFCFVAGNALAVDHTDGHKVIKTPVSDITDLYVFPTEEGKSLAVVLNVHPFVTPDVSFPAEIGYDIIIRKAIVQTENGQAGFATSADDELRITCHFDDKDTPAEQSITCKEKGGMTVTAIVDQVSSTGDFKLFSGNRSDPFFFDADWTREHSCKMTKGEVKPPMPPAPTHADNNTMKNFNVRSIALEFDRAKIFGGEFDLLAVAAETYELEQDGVNPEPHDRTGRPEITNVSLIAHDDETDLRGSYNSDNTFGVSDQHADKYRTRLEDRIKYYDKLGGEEKDWDPAEITSFVNVLLKDHLVVDPAKQCGGNNFLEIERAILAGKPHTTCGGRHMNDDVMDILLSLYIYNDRHSPNDFKGDGIGGPSETVSEQFPFLVEPTPADLDIPIGGSTTVPQSMFSQLAFGEAADKVNCPTSN